MLLVEVSAADVPEAAAEESVADVEEGVLGLPPAAFAGTAVVPAADAVSEPDAAAAVAAALAGLTVGAADAAMVETP